MAMNEQMYDDVALERQLKALFGVDSEIDSVIARRMPVGRSAQATLFLTTKKQLYLYVFGESRLLFADIKKIVSRAGLTAERYLPPKNRPHYFEEVGTAKFQEVFPGRRVANEQDIAFYTTLAPYSPALILIKEVKNGTIYQYDSDASGQWRPSTKLQYRRIATS